MISLSNLVFMNILEFCDKSASKKIFRDCCHVFKISCLFVMKKVSKHFLNMVLFVKPSSL